MPTWTGLSAVSFGHGRVGIWTSAELPASLKCAWISRPAASSECGNFIPLAATALAEAEVEAGEIEAALATIDRVIADSERTGQRWFDAESHRIRGEILLKRDPANTAPAEEAFLTAIAIAQQQKARAFELRAALSLAKLYQSTGRAADAHAVLAPALEGFSPTPEFPEIEEAQALLAALADTDEVKSTAVQRQRRLHLQTAYANALIHARGHAAKETSTAFAKVGALASDMDDAADRFSAYYGVWVGSLNRCEPATMRETAAAFLRETEHRPRSPEAGVAHRIAGLTSLYFGDYTEARTRIEKSLDYPRQRTRSRPRLPLRPGPGCCGDDLFGADALAPRRR